MITKNLFKQNSYVITAIITMYKSYLSSTSIPYILLAIVLAIAAGIGIALMGMIGLAISIMVPIGLAVVISILQNPKIGLFFYLHTSFLVLLVSRFFPINAPIGLAVESLLSLTLISVLLHARQMNWKQLHNPAFYCLLIWIAFTCLEFFNPETPNRVPSWIFRFRAISFQPFCAAIVISVMSISRRDVKVFISTWLIWSFAAALWSFKQQYIGLTGAEAEWLRLIGGKTHLLFGQLRSFSFYTDAAQLGAEMAWVTLFCLIMTFEMKRWGYRIVFLILTLFFFWGYAVTGTRSALFILLVGFPFFLFLKRDILKMSIGGGILTILLTLLMFTNIGNTNYQIYRIRTALNPSKDASYQLRVENQNILVDLLDPLPFGVGLGTSLMPGDIYNPDHWAAQVPADTWYVTIWIEMGKVGVTLYIALLLSYVFTGAYKLWRMKDDWLRTVLMAMLSGFVGLMAMAYSNTILGQLPTTTIMFISIFLFTTADRWDKKSVLEPTT